MFYGGRSLQAWLFLFSLLGVGKGLSAEVLLCPAGVLLAWPQGRSAHAGLCVPVINILVLLAPPYTDNVILLRTSFCFRKYSCFSRRDIIYVMG